MIRMTETEARKAGLLDPLIAKSVSARMPAVSKPKPKKNPKPAALLVDDHVIPGAGVLTVDPQGAVQKAVFTFRIMPVPKERPRVVRDQETDKVRTFTPQRTAAFHKQVHRVLDSVLGSKPLMCGPLHIDMTFRMPIPKSWPKWKQSAAVDGIIRPTGRPDMDNLEKALLDAFNEHIIADDSLVVERTARKIYAVEPGIDANLTRLLAGDVHTKQELSNLIRTISGKLEGQCHEN